jgi:tetratricopeptide (TPR) repeat protein
MMRPRLRPLLTIAILALTALPAIAQPTATPTPEQKAEALKRFQSGQRKFDVGKFEDAALDFEAAYELSGAPTFLFNMAQAYRQGHRYEKALITYRAFLQRDTTNTPYRESAERRIAELVPIVKQQEEERLRKQQEAERLEQQKREDEQRRQRELETARQQQELERLRTSGGAENAKPKQRPMPRWVFPVGIGVAALGVAGLATGLAMSLLARSASNTVQTAAATHAVFDDSLHATEARGKSYDTASIACYVVGGVLAAGGGVLAGVARSRRARAETATIAPALAPGFVGLAAGVRF